MTANSNKNLLIELIRDVTNNHNEKIDPDTQAMSIEGWDSLAQLNIIFAIEAEFNLKMELSDIENFKTVGDFLQHIEKNT